MKYVVDTSIINKLVDGFIHMDELPKDGMFIASHIQFDEINRTKDLTRRSQLLQKFSEVINELLPTETFVLDSSRLDEAKLGKGTIYDAVKGALDLRNGGKSNNSKDALIAEIAGGNGYVLLTADSDLYEISTLHGVGVSYWTTPFRAPRFR